MNEIQYIQKHGANKVRYPAYGRLTDQLQEDGFTGDLDALIRLISACEMVELLGGYEEAKKEFAEQLKADKPYPNETENNKQILLDYRRANNIFEMDDYIIHDGELKVFAMWSTAIEGCAYIGYAYAEDGEMADKDEFRHATDDEIEAGKRLDSLKEAT